MAAGARLVGWLGAVKVKGCEGTGRDLADVSRSPDAREIKTAWGQGSENHTDLSNAVVTCAASSRAIPANRCFARYIPKLGSVGITW